MSGAPPTMAPANLGLRFGLEVAAMVGIYVLVHTMANTPLAVAAVLVAVAVWGVFNVPDDPSRSGRAPVVVSGTVRLLLELGVLVVGAWGLWARWGLAIALPFALLVVGHYTASLARIRWLLGQARQ